MALGPYRQKRRFAVTSEPRGRKATRKGQAFVIQKHAARRLHYDLRLELDGVMKSWAVTRGPSLVAGDKRLAVHVEDHPIDYNRFEGTIPKGEYGGGTVMIWDRGTWIPQGDPRAGYKKGHLDFRLEGEKLGGEWHLVRMRKRAGERQEPWLLIKADDEAARPRRAPDILDEQPLSVASGRSMEEIAAGAKSKTRPRRAAAAAKKAAARPRKPKVAAERMRGQELRKASRAPAAPARGALARAPLPEFVPPCLARLSDAPPPHGAWLHEIKFDGYRIQARLQGGKVALRTRTGLDWTRKFPAIAQALQPLPAGTALIDGEIVVETAHGLSSFSALQEALASGRGAFVFYVFDLLHLDGHDLRAAPLIERKRALAELIEEAPAGGPLRLSEHFDTEGSLLLKHACKMTLEGIVSKRRDAPYRSGRTGDWIKTKCSGRQEFVIAGFTPASNDAKAVGALILGYYEEGALRYAGRVGTGFTRQSARDLWKRLQPLRRAGAPFAPVPVEERRRGAVWLAPRLVAEVDFTGWTGGRLLRHPSFKGLRDDKAATDVVREKTAMATRQYSATRQSSAARKPAKRGGAAGKKGAPATVAGIALSHPDRVYWDDVGLTKQALADYYVAVWDWIAPHVQGRVLSLLRCPEGAAGACFFQKHATAGLDSPHLKRVREEGDEVIAIDSLDGLIALVQAGVLEVHVRGSRIDRLEAADRVVFDLDPGPDVGWAEVKRAAAELRARLQGLGLESFLKTTGGKGLHVVVPIVDTTWGTVKVFARGVAQDLADAEPQRFVAVAAKSKRQGRIFIDYLRNSREATAIAPYSTRARAGATVAVPLAWAELGGLVVPNKFTVANVPARLRRLQGDPWAELAGLQQSLPGSGGRSRAVAKK